MTGPTGPQGPEGSKSAVIRTRDGYRQVDCIEAPEVLFFDIMTIVHSGMVGRYSIDPLFIEVCEPKSIHVVSMVPNIPSPVGASIIDNDVEIRALGKEEVTCRVMLAGVRKGFAGRRFIPRTEDDYFKNVRFWRQLA